MKNLILIIISFFIYENAIAQGSSDTLKYFYKKIHSENCKAARENKKKANDELWFCDTLCSTIDIDLLVIDDSKKNSFLNEKIQSSIEKPYADTGEILKMIDSTAGYEFNFTVICEFNQKNIFSYLVSNFVFGCGAAHPSHDFSFFNYDLKTQKKISLDELFIPNYQNDLNKIAEKLFLEQNKGSLEYLDLEPGKFNLNQNFLIQKDGLLFLFNEYEIGAYVVGAPEVFIPYKEISSVINKNGILARLIGK